MLRGVERFFYAFFIRLNMKAYYLTNPSCKCFEYVTKSGQMTNPTPLGWGTCMKNKLGFSQKLSTNIK